MKKFSVYNFFWGKIVTSYNFVPGTGYAAPYLATLPYLATGTPYPTYLSHILLSCTAACLVTLHPT